jgi:hypothetical protein
MKLVDALRPADRAIVVEGQARHNEKAHPPRDLLAEPGRSVTRASEDTDRSEIVQRRSAAAIS